MASKMRASGRKRARGSDKPLIALQKRQQDWENLSAVDKSSRRRPGSRQKHR